jgi:hypothetical protein
MHALAAQVSMRHFQRGEQRFSKDAANHNGRKVVRNGTPANGSKFYLATKWYGDEMEPTWSRRRLKTGTLVTLLHGRQCRIPATHPSRRQFDGGAEAITNRCRNTTD